MKLLKKSILTGFLMAGAFALAQEAQAGWYLGGNMHRDAVLQSYESFGFDVPTTTRVGNSYSADFGYVTSSGQIFGAEYKQGYSAWHQIFVGEYRGASQLTGPFFGGGGLRLGGARVKPFYGFVLGLSYSAGVLAGNNVSLELGGDLDYIAGLPRNALIATATVTLRFWTVNPTGGR